MERPFVVTLADCYSSLVNGQWRDAVEVKRFSTKEDALAYANDLRDTGIKTPKSFDEKWIIEVRDESKAIDLYFIRF